MNAIHLISASAGSGKTHRLVDALERAITSVENPVRPEAVIATTFTVKASAELRERVRARLLEGGLVAQAQRLAMARIGIGRLPEETDPPAALEHLELPAIRVQPVAPG